MLIKEFDIQSALGTIEISIEGTSFAGISLAWNVVFDGITYEAKDHPWVSELWTEYLKVSYKEDFESVLDPILREKLIEEGILTNE